MFVCIEMGLALEAQVDLVGIGMLVHFKSLADVGLGATLPANLEDQRLLDIYHDTCDAHLDDAITLFLHDAAEELFHALNNKFRLIFEL